MWVLSNSMLNIARRTKFQTHAGSSKSAWSETLRITFSDNNSRERTTQQEEFYFPVLDSETFTPGCWATDFASLALFSPTSTVFPQCFYSCVFHSFRHTHTSEVRGIADKRHTSPSFISPGRGTGCWWWIAFSRWCVCVCVCITVTTAS